jgi:hypothetical protein
MKYAAPGKVSLRRRTRLSARDRTVKDRDLARCRATRQRAAGPAGGCAGSSDRREQRKNGGDYAEHAERSACTDRRAQPERHHRLTPDRGSPMPPGLGN